MQTKPKAPTDTDREMGLLLRHRRKQIGLTQADVGAALHVSMQQVQKYECGQDRISAASLFKVAQLLGVDLPYFFRTAEQHPNGSHEGSICYEMVEAFMRIKSRAKRKKLLELIETLSD